MKRILAVVVLCVAACMALSGCGEGATAPSTSSSSQPAQSSSSTASSSAEKSQGIDYLALVNRLNALPNGWEDALETVHFTNSIGDDVEVEKKAYDAYLELKADLEKEGVHVDLDSARRSVDEQERIVADFYFLETTKKTSLPDGWNWMDEKMPAQLGKPRLVEHLLSLL